MKRQLSHLAVLVGLAASAQVAIAADVGCADLLPPHIDPSAPTHPITARDLVHLRDLVGVRTSGPAGGVVEQVLALSPDGQQIAVLLQRGDPVRNGYCIGVAVIPLQGNAAPRIVHQQYEPSDGQPEPPGILYQWRRAQLAAPRWSPDGNWIGFLQRNDGVVNLWRIPADGGDPERITESPVDVRAFTWSADGRTIVFASRPGLLEAQRTIEEEGRRGFHYDDRFAPHRSGRPYVTDPITTEILAIDVVSRRVTPANDGQARLLDTVFGGGAAPRLSVATPQGDEARIVPAEEGAVFSPSRIVGRSADGAAFTCDVEECRNLVDLWWAPGGAELILLRREGWGDRASLGVYRWRPAEARPSRIFSIDELLAGCELASAALVCAHEAPTIPRRIVRVDLETGAVSEIFDPNPERHLWRFGTVERLDWETEYGTPAFGHLVLPPDHAPGRPLPLVVVGYLSQGFLRGGVGDEYPIHAFAARGYAVLSYNRPRTWGAERSWPDRESAGRARTENWIDRRNVQSALEVGVRLLRDRGLIAEGRLGLTGFSEGSTALEWALVNSDLFSAYSASVCCYGPTTVMGGIVGISVSERFAPYGYPRTNENGAEFWRPISIELNAERITAPLLIQAGDGEYIGALPGFTRLRDLGRPVDMYVFPDEGHYKWHPAHRLAVYERNLDWFDFWLRGIENDAPGREAEYARWRTWRDASAGD